MEKLKELTAEQKIEINNSNITQCNLFCPLINSECQHNCNCFVKANFYLVKYNDGEVKELFRAAYCSNFMFTGEV